MHWYLLAWQRATEIRGRSRRKEYWMFSLFTMLIGILLLAVLALFPQKGDPAGLAAFGVFWIFMVVSFVPSITCQIRRLHDVGRSGWWILLGLIPLGGLVVFIFTVLDSEPGPNQWGENPKAIA